MTNKEALGLLGESRMRKITEYDGLALGLAIKGKPVFGEKSAFCEHSVTLADGTTLTSRFTHDNNSLEGTTFKSKLNRIITTPNFSIYITDSVETSILGDRFTNSRQIASTSAHLSIEDGVKIYTGVSDKTMPWEVKDAITELELPSIQGLHKPIIKALRQAVEQSTSK